MSDRIDSETASPAASSAALVIRRPELNLEKFSPSRSWERDKCFCENTLATLLLIRSAIVFLHARQRRHSATGFGSRNTSARNQPALSKFSKKSQTPWRCRIRAIGFWLYVHTTLSGLFSWPLVLSCFQEPRPFAQQEPAGSGGREQVASSRGVLTPPGVVAPGIHLPVPATGGGGRPLLGGTTTTTGWTLLQQLQRDLRCGIGLGHDRDAGLLEDAITRHVSSLRGEVHVTNAALGSHQVLRVGLKVVKR